MSKNGLIVEILFRSIFHKVLHSTIDFVWSTPVGKIVNRFSKDMDETDIVRLLILLNWRMTRDFECNVMPFSGFTQYL